jgi:alpha/beta superfamily hydrolase
MVDDSGPGTRGGATTVEGTSCHTSDGLVLEAELAMPASPTGAVVLAHPHPQQGGSMRSLVTSELFRALPGDGIATLRFNFRGVEGSEGTYGGGVDERRDVIAAIERLRVATAVEPLVLAGWSFGADVSASVLDDRLAGWFLIGPPLRVLPSDQFVIASDPRPKHIAVPEHDMFRPPDSAREATSTWVNTTVDVVAGADHFLVGRTAKVATAVVEFVRDLA